MENAVLPMRSKSMAWGGGAGPLAVRRAPEALGVYGASTRRSPITFSTWWVWGNMSTGCTASMR